MIACFPECPLVPRSPLNRYPIEFSERITGAFGEEGRNWLSILPDLIDDLASRWSLSIGSPFPEMAYNYVVSVVTEDGSEAVLKVGVPNRELKTEIEALRVFNGRGTVRLIQADAQSGAILLERLRPGKSLLSLDDTESTRIAAGVMAKMWTTPPEENAFPSVADWAMGFDRLRGRFGGGTGPFPEDLIPRAERMFEELLGSADEPVLLHGDLHHSNVLSAGSNRWLAIDPKGVICEPAYEVGAWLRNPVPEILRMPDLEKVTARRLDQFADLLGMDRERLKGWGFAQAVLSAWWSYEDNDRRWRKPISIAETLEGAR